jgi:hypothetical protein
MPMFKTDRCRLLAGECRRLASLSENALEKRLLTNLALSWNRLANQTDRYVEFLARLPNKKVTGRGHPT